MGANETRIRDSRKKPPRRPPTGNSGNRPRHRAKPVPRGICAAMLLLTVLITSCGKSGSSSSTSPPPPTANTVGLVVDAGPTGACTNCLYTKVTVCVPGTSTCQPIDHVLVDTGSFGLRLVAASSGGELSLSLTQQTNSSGVPIAECPEFADSIVWGPVAAADVQIAGEKASSVPIQIIGDATYPDATIPSCASCCKNSGLTPNDTVSKLGANGIIGVGVFTDDCGSGCASTASNFVYYACPTPSTCAPTIEPKVDQLQNPVWKFATDNNGLSISLPSIPPTGAGAASETGTLTFGIGTQSNNGLGNATVYSTNGFGNFTTQYKGTDYSGSFLDTGSGGMFFLDSATALIPECTATTCPATGAMVNLSGLYCPSMQASLSATNVGQNGNSGTVSFTVSNADTLFCNNPSSWAFSDLAGIFGAPPLEFDWGLNFFYGRTVFVGIEGQTTPGGMGPYWAY
jgi:uncharacterized protein DUF3443